MLDFATYFSLQAFFISVAAETDEAEDFEDDIQDNNGEDFDNDEDEGKYQNSSYRAQYDISVMTGE